MRELNEVISVVQTPRISVLKNFADGGPPGTKLSTLCVAIRDGKVTNDDEAAQLIYGCSPSDKRYMMLRKNLTDYLAQTIAQYDFSKIQSEHSTAEDDSIRALFAVRKLAAFGYYSTAVKIAERMLREAQVSNFSDLETAALRFLREAASREGNHAEYEAYNMQLKSAMAQYDAEMQAQGYCEAVEIHFASDTAETKSTGALAEENCRKAGELLKGFPKSATIQLYYFRLQLLVEQIYKRFNEAIAICDEAEAYLHTQPVIGTKARFAEFATVKMNCLLSLGNYEQAVAHGDVLAGIYREGSNNWFNVQHLMFLAAMHTLNFEKAAAIYLHGISLKQEFANMPESFRERWMLYGAYLWLAVTAIHPGSIKDSVLRKRLFRNVEAQTLLKNMPELEKSKAGYIIPLLLAQLLYFNKQEEKKQYKARLRMLKQLAKKSLADSLQGRTTHFLQMIRTTDNREELLQQLSELPKTTQQFSEGVEVLPYETLWPHIIRNKNAVEA